MRPAFARTSFRVASSFASRNSVRAGASSSTRPCSTSTVPNDPLVKHTSVSGVSTSEALRTSNASSSIASEEERRLNMTAASTGSSGSSNGDSADVGSIGVPAAESDGSSPAVISQDLDTPSSATAPSSELADSFASSMEVSERTTESATSSVPEATGSADADADAVSSTPDSAIGSSAVRPEPPTSPTELLSDLKGFIRRNAVRSALYHYIGALKVEGAPAVDEAVLKTVLPVLGRYGWAPTSLDSVNLALSRHYNLEVGFYNCALHAMARSGDFDTIIDVIQKMWALQLESRPNATSYNYLIGSFMYRGSVDRAFDVLNDMKKHMIYPTFATYHALITGCLRSNDPRRAFTTLTAVERQRFDIGAMTISQVLVACADADMPDEVIQLLPRFEEAMPRYAQELHRIAEKRNAYKISSPARTTPEDRAVVRGTPKIEIGAIFAIVHCAFRTGRADLGMVGWSLLRKYYPDVTPPPTLWYCLIGSLASSGEFQKAFDALGMMREVGHKPRLKDLEAALIKPLSAEVSRIDEQYYRLCDQAKGKTSVGVVVDVVENVEGEAGTSSGSESVGAVSPSIEVEAAAGEAVEEETPVAEEVEGEESEEFEKDEKLSLKDVLSEKNTSPLLNPEWTGMTPEKVGIDEVNCVIAACSHAGDLDRAFQTYDEVETTFGLEKNINTFNALLEGCIQVKHVRGGMRILSEMEKKKIKVGGETVLLVVRLMTRGGKALECVDFLKKTKSRGGNMPLQAYLVLLRYYVRGDSMDHAVEVYRMGQEDGYSDRVLKGRLDYDGSKKLEAMLEGRLHTGEEESEQDFRKLVEERGAMDDREAVELIDELENQDELFKQKQKEDAMKRRGKS